MQVSNRSTHNKRPRTARTGSKYYIEMDMCTVERPTRDVAGTRQTYFCKILIRGLEFKVNKLKFFFRFSHQCVCKI
jgi:hypothetical protein